MDFFSSKGDNLPDFLFASLQTKPLRKSNLFLKENTSSSKAIFYLLGQFFIDKGDKDI